MALHPSSGMDPGEILLRAIFGNDHEKEDLMTLEVKTYSRIPFDVEAVQVTEDNFDEITRWVADQGGTATWVGPQPNISVQNHLRVLVYEGRGEKFFRAFVGDWVVRSESKGFKVFNDSNFKRTFA